MTRKAVVVLRVSTDEQHLGPAAQQADCERFAAHADLEIVATFMDIGVSGATPIDEREGFMQAMTSAPDLGAEVLLVQGRDRLARSISVAIAAEEALRSQGMVLLAADGSCGLETGDPDDPDAFMMKAIRDVFAQYERLTIKMRTKKALRVKKLRGERHCKDAPLGKMLDPNDPKRLVPNPVEEEAIQAARLLRGEKMSLRKISAELAQLGHFNRAGNQLTAEQVRRMVV